MFSKIGNLTIHDDVSIRYGISNSTTGQKKGSVILLNGRSEFLEKYAEVATDLGHRGFDVFSFDWRGQGLSSRMLPNRYKGYVDSYDSYLNDLETFVDNIVKPEGTSPFILLAHSMGGLIALHYLNKQGNLIDKAILVSSMLKINTSPHPLLVAKLKTWLAIKKGQGKTYVPGPGDYDFCEPEFEGNKLTSDPERFLVQYRAIMKNNELALGGVTYQWLSESFKSMKILQQQGYVEQIKTPVLMIGAGADKVVENSEQKKICNRLPNSRYMEIPGSRHEVLMETDDVRAIFWDAFFRFVG